MSKVLIYGLGVSGLGAITLLRRLGESIAVYCDGYCMPSQDIENRTGYVGVDAILENIKYIVISPSVPPDSLVIKTAKARGIKVVPELELGASYCKSDIICVTGTNGKTTTVELIARFFNDVHINTYKLGNIGESICSKALDILPHDLAIVEASSFQLEGTSSFAPKIAVCLNVTPDHIERHKTMEAYITAKSKIFAFQTPNDYALLNYDDTIVRDMGQSTIANTYYFSTKSIVRGAYVCGSQIYFKNDTTELVCSVEDILMSGEHNLENALACICIAKILNYPNTAIIKTLNEFMPPRHRVEYVGAIDGVRYYNDSKATNISSTLVACKSMVGRTALILGGYDKGLSYKPLFDNIPLKITTVICYGANKEKIIADALQVSNITLLKALTLKHAIELARCIKVKNVLFSPATSSFDSFRNYEERGDYFVGIVKEMLSEK